MNENDVYVVVCCCIPTTWDFHTKTHFDWELSTHYNSVWVICFCFVSQSKDWWFKKLTYSKRTWNLAHGCILFKIDVFELRRRQQKRELFLRKKSTSFACEIFPSKISTAWNLKNLLLFSIFYVMLCIYFVAIMFRESVKIFN